MWADTKKQSASKIPVVEFTDITLQGEGPAVGAPCHFLRVAGCGYKCNWCDTMYAVQPKKYGTNVEWYECPELVQKVIDESVVKRVVISGGDPCLYDFTEFCASMRDSGFEVHVETQGQYLPRWLGAVHMVSISPKPPSAGYGEKQPPLYNGNNAFWKLVVDPREAADIEWVVKTIDLLHENSLIYVNAITRPGAKFPSVVDVRLLLKKLQQHPLTLQRVFVGVQYHKFLRVV